MIYQEHSPAPDLCRFVDRYWTLSGAGAGPEVVLPDGHCEIVVHSGDPFRTADGAEQPLSLWVGPTTTPVSLLPGSRVEVFGVRFRPAGVAALARETSGRIVQLTDVLPSTADLCLANANAELRRLLWPPDPRVELAAAMLGRPGVRIAAAAAAVNCGCRQLERLFLENTGLTPKMFARLQRFQFALRLRRDRPLWPWSRIAAEAHYSDQAHLIAEFRQFSGTTPADPPPGQLANALSRD